MNGEEKNVVRGVDVKEPADETARRTELETNTEEIDTKVHYYELLVEQDNRGRKRPKYAQREKIIEEVLVEYYPRAVVDEEGSYDTYGKRAYSYNPKFLDELQYREYGKWEGEPMEVTEEEFEEAEKVNDVFDFFEVIDRGVKDIVRIYRKIIIYTETDKNKLLYYTTNNYDSKTRKALKIIVDKQYFTSICDILARYDRRVMYAYKLKK